MKHKNKVKKLQSRIKDYEQTVAKTANPRAFHKPGSFNK